MNNVTIIERLKDINQLVVDDYTLSDKLNNLINDLKQEEMLKGFSASDKERFNIALKLQKKGFKSTRPILGLWNLNKTDNKYYWTNAVFMVRIPKEELQEGLFTTDDTFSFTDNKSYPIFTWKPNQTEYPNCDHVWLKSGKEIKVDIKNFMAFLKTNKKEEIVSMTIDGTVIYFNPEHIYNALILSKVAFKETATLRYLSDLKPFQFDDNCLCTPMRRYEDSEQPIVPNIDL